jgi:hypothetical protein
VSIALWVLGVGLVIFGGSGSHIFLAIVLGVAAYYLGKKSNQAYEIEAQEARLANEIKTNQIGYKKQLVREVQIDKEAELELELMYLRNATSTKEQITFQKAQDTAQRELELRDQLIGIGQQQGLTADAVVEVNKTKYLSEIDIEKDYKIRMNELRGILAVKMFTYSRIKEMRGSIKELLIERHEVSESELPAPVKHEYVALLDDTITTYKKAYSVGQNRLLEATDGEDLEGIDDDADLSGGVGHGGPEIKDEV